MNRTLINRIMTISFILVLFLGSSSTQAQSDALYTEQSTYFIIDEESDLPPVTPLDIVKDDYGNIHSWFIYIEPNGQLLSIYYQIVFLNGSNFLARINQDFITNTQFYFLQKLQLSTYNGNTFGVFLDTSDFGVRLIQFGWNPDESFYFNPLSIGNILPQGDIFGPFQNGTEITYLLTANSGGNEILLSVEFDDGSYTGYEQLARPFDYADQDSNPLYDIFDVQYYDGMIYALGSLQTQSQEAEMRLVQQENDTHYNTIASNDLNVFPVAPQIGFIRVILGDLVRPELEITDNGNLYTFFFSLNENNPLRDLRVWTNGSAINAITYEEENPFQNNFLPNIDSIGDTVRVGALGINFASGVISVTADRYIYDTVEDVLHKDKIEDPSFSSNIFLLSFDLTSDDILGIAGTLTVPDYIKNEDRVLNETVGSLTIFSDQNLPETNPRSIEVFFESTETGDSTDTQDTVIISIIILVTASISIIAVWFLRKKQLELPENLQQDDRNNSKIEKMRTFFFIQKIFIKTNRRRILISIFVLLIPSLLIITLFSGLITHQDNLLNTYDQSNPINNPNTIISQEGDFTWTRSLYNDELTNNTISAVEWELPEVLTSLSMNRFGASSIIESLTYTTVFPLHEKRIVTFLNEDGENQTIHYPFSHNVAVIPDSMNSYLEAQLIEGRMPQNENEILIQRSWFVPRDGFNTSYDFGLLFDSNDEIELYASELDIFFNSTVSGLSQNLTIVGEINPVESLTTQEIVNWAQIIGISVPALRLLDNVPFYSTPELITEFLNEYSRLSIRPVSFVDVRYDLESIERDEIPEIVDNLERMLNETLQETGFAWIGSFNDEDVISFLSGYFDASRDILVETTVLIIPMISLIIFLTYEALSIGRSSIQEELLRFEKEGIKFENVFILLLSERMISAALASSLAFLFIGPLLDLTLSFTDIFDTRKHSLDLIGISQIGIIVGLNFVLMTLIGIVQSIRYYISARTWQFQSHLTSYQKDIIIIISALVLFGLASFLVNLFDDQLIENADQETSDLFVLSMRTTSLILLALSGLLIGSKLIGRIFIGIGYFVWQFRKTRFSLISKGISSHSGLYGKVTIAVLLSFFIILPMILVPNTLIEEYTQDAYYDLGTDMIMQNINELSEDELNNLESLDEFSNISPYYSGVLDFANGIRIRILAINTSTFLQSTYIPYRYTNDFQFSDEIVENLEENEVITNRDFIDRNPFEIGDTFQLAYNHLDSDTNSSFTIAGEYREFPIMRYELLQLENSDIVPLQMIITLSTLRNIQSFYELNSTSLTSIVVEDLERRNMAMRLSEGVSENQGLAAIEEISENQVVLLSDISVTYRHPFFDIFEYISHLSLIVAFVSPVLASYIVSNVMFERRKFELEVYHRNGISVRYFTTQLTLELILTSLLPGTILGFSLGFWWTSNYGPELFGETLLGLPWQVPINLLYGLVFALPFIAMVVWFEEIYTRSKRHLSEVRL